MDSNQKLNGYGDYEFFEEYYGKLSELYKEDRVLECFDLVKDIGKICIYYFFRKKDIFRRA
jgi:hypothetical protein